MQCVPHPSPVITELTKLSVTESKKGTSRCEPPLSYLSTCHVFALIDKQRATRGPIRADSRLRRSCASLGRNVRRCGRWLGIPVNPGSEVVRTLSSHRRRHIGGIERILSRRIVEPAWYVVNNCRRSSHDRRRLARPAPFRPRTGTIIDQGHPFLNGDLDESGRTTLVRHRRLCQVGRNVCCRDATLTHGCRDAGGVVRRRTTSKSAHATLGGLCLNEAELGVHHVE